MDNAIAIDNDTLRMGEATRTLTGDHESRVTDTGTSIVQTFCKTGHAVNAQGDGEKYASSSSSSTLNTFENHTDGRAVDIVVSPPVCKTLSAEGFDGMPDIQKGNGMPVVAIDGNKLCKNERAGGSGLGVSTEGVMYTETACDNKHHAVAVRTANTHANGCGVAEEATHTLDRASGQAVAVGNPWDTQSQQVHIGDGAFPPLAANGKTERRHDGSDRRAIVVEAAIEVPVLDMMGGKAGANFTTDGATPALTHGRGSVNDVHAVALGFKAGQSANGGIGAEEEVCPTQSHQPSALEPTVAVGVDAYNQTLTGGVSMTNTAKNADPHHVPCVSLNHIVRRLTPTECERLQGFPDGWTRIPYRGKPADECPDSPRYKALGNSWATNCAEYILRRIVAAFRLDLVPEAAE